MLSKTSLALCSMGGSVDLNKMEEIANKATGGKWKTCGVDRGDGRSVKSDRLGCEHIRVSTPAWAGRDGSGHVSQKQRDADAKFIATFCPQEVLKLLEIARAAEMIFDGAEFVAAYGAKGDITITRAYKALKKALSGE